MDSSDQKTHRIDAGGDSAESSKSVGKTEGSTAKSVKQKDAEWGYEPRKAGMAVEAKLGMAVVAVLLGVFGFLVYRNFNLKQQQIAAIKGFGSEGEADKAKGNVPKLKGDSSPTGDSAEGGFANGKAGIEDLLLTAEADGLPDPHNAGFSEDGRDDAGFEETSLTLDDDPGVGLESQADALLNELLADRAGVSELEESGFDTAEPEVAVTDTQRVEPELFSDFGASEEEKPLSDSTAVTDTVAVAESGDDVFPPSVADTRSADTALESSTADEFPAFDDGEEALASDTTPADDDGTLLAPANTIDLTPVTQTSEADSDPRFSQESTAEEVQNGLAETEFAAENDDVFEKSLVGNREEVEVEPNIEEFAELVGQTDRQPPSDRLLALAEPQDDELLQTLGDERSSVTAKSRRPSIDPAFDQVVYDADPAPVSNSQSRIQQASDAVSELCDICEARQDDNYWKISKRMYGTARYFSALALFNKQRIPDPRMIRPGMKILIPEAKLLEKKYPELFRGYVRAPKKPTGFFLMADGTPAYRVGERETLSEISQKHLGRASRWIQIWRLNQTVLSDPNKVKPGTVLALPDDATNLGVAN